MAPVLQLNLLLARQLQPRAAGAARRAVAVVRRTVALLPKGQLTPHNLAAGLQSSRRAGATQQPTSCASLHSKPPIRHKGDHSHLSAHPLSPLNAHPLPPHLLWHVIAAHAAARVVGLFVAAAVVGPPLSLDKLHARGAGDRRAAGSAHKAVRVPAAAHGGDAGAGAKH